MWKYAICRDGKQKFNLIPYLYRMKDGSYRHCFRSQDIDLFSTKKAAQEACLYGDRPIEVWINV